MSLLCRNVNTKSRISHLTYYWVLGCLCALDQGITYSIIYIFYLTLFLQYGDEL